MMCMKCLIIQPVGPTCSTPACHKLSMARYYCRVCNLFDDERCSNHYVPTICLVFLRAPSVFPYNNYLLKRTLGCANNVDFLAFPDYILIICLQIFISWSSLMRVVDREIYHCPYCNLCRVGKGLGIDYFHCMTCNACMSRSLSVHICREKCFEDYCPICHEFIFTSSSPVKALPCGHLMHSTCFKVFIKYKVPIFFFSLDNAESIRLIITSDDAIRPTLVRTIPAQFAASHLGICRFALYTISSFLSSVKPDYISVKILFALINYACATK